MNKALDLQIGSYRLRDPVTKCFETCKPLYKTIAIKVAESLVEITASLLVDCYEDWCKHEVNDDRMCA